MMSRTEAEKIAEWLVGKRLEKFSRLGVQKQILAEIIIADNKVDAVIIARNRSEKYYFIYLF